MTRPASAAPEIAPPRPRSRRMNPELRKGLILDVTAGLIAREGVSAVSMERVGREAGVSKALIYKHFPDRTTLLQALLVRDQRRLVDRQVAAVRGVAGLEALIAVTTRTYLQHVEEGGLYIQRLMNEPSVVAAFREMDRRERRRAVEFLARTIAESLNLPPEIATLATELSMGMTAAAGEMISRGGAAREDVEALLLTMFKGSIVALRAAYGGD